MGEKLNGKRIENDKPSLYNVRKQYVRVGRVTLSAKLNPFLEFGKDNASVHGFTRYFNKRGSFEIAARRRRTFPARIARNFERRTPYKYKALFVCKHYARTRITKWYIRKIWTYAPTRSAGLLCFGGYFLKSPNAVQRVYSIDNGVREDDGGEEKKRVRATTLYRRRRRFHGSPERKSFTYAIKVMIFP